jgi:hypothetical protein
MELYEIKVKYTRQNGEYNLTHVKETYLVGGIYPSSVEQQLLEEIKPLISGECEVTSIRKRVFYDIINKQTNDICNFYECKVELIAIEDNGSEKRKGVAILLEAEDINDAVRLLNASLSNLDCEIVGIKKSQIIDFYTAV